MPAKEEARYLGAIAMFEELTQQLRLNELTNDSCALILRTRDEFHGLPLEYKQTRSYLGKIRKIESHRAVTIMRRYAALRERSDELEGATVSPRAAGRLLQALDALAGDTLLAVEEEADCVAPSYGGAAPLRPVLNGAPQPLVDLGRVRSLSLDSTPTPDPVVLKKSQLPRQLRHKYRRASARVLGAQLAQLEPMRLPEQTSEGKVGLRLPSGLCTEISQLRAIAASRIGTEMAECVPDTSQLCGERFENASLRKENKELAARVAVLELENNLLRAAQANF